MQKSEICLVLAETEKNFTWRETSLFRSSLALGTIFFFGCCRARAEYNKKVKLYGRDELEVYKPTLARPFIFFKKKHDGIYSHTYNAIVDDCDAI